MTEPAFDIGASDPLRTLDLFGVPIEAPPASPLADRFGVPPFSVLSSRDGDWQERKRAWLALGIKSELGRDAATFEPGPGMVRSQPQSGPSIFDPVLCELMYRWHTPPGAQVVDPFAGGSVRGIVAAKMGRKYWGGELRAEQVDENRRQAAKICGADGPAYAVGDSAVTLDGAPLADFIFSCPPYGDLEVYSDDDADLSAMAWPDFRAGYAAIIAKACARLRPDRFAAFVVGDFRCKRGFYRGFIGETIAAFEAAGARFYNEAILVAMVASASLRAGRQFDASRKLVKVHQNILIFCKGDPKRAARYAKGAHP